MSDPRASKRRNLMKSILKLFFVFSVSLFLIIVAVVNGDRAFAEGMPDRGAAESCCQIPGSYHSGTA